MFGAYRAGFQAEDFFVVWAVAWGIAQRLHGAARQDFWPWGFGGLGSSGVKLCQQSRVRFSLADCRCWTFCSSSRAVRKVTGILSRVAILETTRACFHFLSLRRPFEFQEYRATLLATVLSPCGGLCCVSRCPLWRVSSHALCDEDRIVSARFGACRGLCLMSP